MKNGIKSFLNYSYDYSYMAIVRIKLNSTDINLLNDICNSVKEIAKKSGITIRGPVPLPTKKLKVTTRKSPCGDGTATFDRLEMRIQKKFFITL